MNSDVSTVSSLLNANISRECEWYIREISAAINLLIGLPLNSYMVWLIITDPAQKLASCFLELNLALCDMLFIVLSPFILVPNCKHLYVPKSIQYVRYLCYAILLAGRPMFQTLICVERYVAVLYPLVFLRYGVLRYKFKCVCVGWFVVLTVSLIIIFYFMKAWYMLVFLALIFILVKLFCFWSVLRALKQPKPGDGGRERGTTNQAKIRAIKIIVIWLISSIVQYVPLLLIWLMYLCLPESSSLVLATEIIFCIMIGAGFIEPLLFLQRSGKLPWKRNCSN